MVVKGSGKTHPRVGRIDGTIQGEESTIGKGDWKKATIAWA